MTARRTLLLSVSLLGGLLVTQLCAARASLAQPPTVAAGTVDYPDTPAGRKMALYQAALASGDLVALRRFFETHFPKYDADVLVEETIIARNQSGGFDPIAVDPRSTPNGVAVKSRSRYSGREVLQVLVVEPSPPHNVSAIGLASAGYDIGPALAQASASVPASTATAATPSLPDTPAAKRAAGFLDAINSRDPARLEAFAREHYPQQIGNPQGRLIQERTGGLDVVSVDQSSETELLLTLKSRASGASVTMRTAVGATPPHQVISIGLVFGSP